MVPPLAMEMGIPTITTPTRSKVDLHPVGIGNGKKAARRGVDDNDGTCEQQR